MFLDILDQTRIELLRQIVEIEPVPKAYLAGGTGLALLLGHRESIDFDWFSQEKFQIQEIIDKLSTIGKVKVTETTAGTFHGFVNDIRVTWLYYPNPLIDNIIESEQIPGLKIASLKDIGLMKWIALSQRGARKDFIDLYLICQQGVTLELLCQLLPQKFPGVDINYYHLIKSLSYFTDAERELVPVMKTRFDWEIVKNYFKDKQRELLAGSVQ